MSNNNYTVTLIFVDVNNQTSRMTVNYTNEIGLDDIKNPGFPQFVKDLMILYKQLLPVMENQYKTTIKQPKEVFLVRNGANKEDRNIVLWPVFEEVKKQEEVSINKNEKDPLEQVD